VKPDYQRIKALELSELGVSEPKAVAELPGYVVLMDSKDREASDRVPVTFTVGAPRQGGVGELKLDIRINGGPIELIPTRFGMVRAMAVFDDGGTMPACSPDWLHLISPGDTYQINP
jgi:hypothetical protein